jgi:hypothetical protein
MLRTDRNCQFLQNLNIHQNSREKFHISCTAFSNYEAKNMLIEEGTSAQIRGLQSVR